MLFAGDYPYSKKETMKLFILDENLNDDKMAKILNNCKNKSGKDCFINGILFVNNQYFEQNLSLALETFLLFHAIITIQMVVLLLVA